MHFCKIKVIFIFYINQVKKILYFLMKIINLNLNLKYLKYFFQNFDKPRP